jgi:hypothetical protein
VAYYTARRDDSSELMWSRHMLAYKVSNWIILDHLSTYNEAYEPVSINDVLSSLFGRIIDSHGKVSNERTSIKDMSIEKTVNQEDCCWDHR